MKKKQLSETILVETEQYVLKIVTTHDQIRTPIATKMTYRVPGMDDPMSGEMTTGFNEESISTHTIELQHTATGDHVRFTCDGDELSALIAALGKARRSEYLS